MKAITSTLLLSIALSVFVSSCDKIEDTDRTVVATTMHPPGIIYVLQLGVNEAGSVVQGDTTGAVTITIDAQVGDAIYYNMSTPAQGSQLNFSVNGTDKLLVDLSGDSQNTAAGFFVVD